MCFKIDINSKNKVYICVLDYAYMFASLSELKINNCLSSYVLNKEICMHMYFKAHIKSYVLVCAYVFALIERTKRCV